MISIKIRVGEYDTVVISKSSAVVIHKFLARASPNRVYKKIIEL